ncbi:MAG: BT_3928 family protein [Bacteroidota bacterium]
MKIITAISRFLVGVLFIISGLIKANDAVGFSYKLDEYFTVFNTQWMIPASIPMAMLICILEVGLGVALLVGFRMVLVSWLLLLLIVFFTFLTFYSAYFDVVKDCGCFGDALHLKPWESFGKDIALLFFILIIFSQRKKIAGLFSERANSLITIAGFVLTAWFTWNCYAHLPAKDFRPYAIGKNISEGMKLPPGAVTDSVVMVFIYEKDGKQMEFKMDELAKISSDTTYKFVDRKDKVVREGDHAPIHDFSIKDAEGSDYTEEFLNKPDYIFMLVAYDLGKTNTKAQSKINDFVALCEQKKVEFFGITSAIPSEADNFRHEYQSMFPYYFCDATTLKTIIRSNPGLVLLKQGTVIDMWHYNDFPTFDEVNKKYLKK